MCILGGLYIVIESPSMGRKVINIKKTCLLKEVGVPTCMGSIYSSYLFHTSDYKIVI